MRQRCILDRPAPHGTVIPGAESALQETGLVHGEYAFELYGMALGFRSPWICLSWSLRRGFNTATRTAISSRAFAVLA